MKSEQHMQVSQCSLSSTFQQQKPRYIVVSEVKSSTILYMHYVVAKGQWHYFYSCFYLPASPEHYDEQIKSFLTLNGDLLLEDQKTTTLIFS